MVDVRILMRERRTLNCYQKTMKVIREIQENLLCVGKRKEAHRSEKGGDEELVQQDWTCAERKAHNQQLQGM